MKRRGFTLVEMLVSMAVLSVVFAVAGVIFTQGWRASARMVRQAEHRQTDYVLVRLWQEAVRGSDPGAWQVTSNRFTGRDRSVFQDRFHLVIRKEDGEKRFRLPSGTTCSFAIERPANLAPCAVLTVIHQETGAAGPSRRAAHFVACGRKP